MVQGRHARHRAGVRDREPRRGRHADGARPAFGLSERVVKRVSAGAVVGPRRGWHARPRMARPCWDSRCPGALAVPFERRQDLTNIRAAPSWAHPFGQFRLPWHRHGRPGAGRALAVLVGLASSLLGLMLGATIGIIADYRRGRADRGIVVGSMCSLPFRRSSRRHWRRSWGQSLTNPDVRPRRSHCSDFARAHPAATLPLARPRFRPGLADDRCSSSPRDGARLLRNIAVPLLSYALLAVGIVIAVEGALSFFGAGVPDRYTTWGKLIVGRAGAVDRSPHLSDPVGSDRAHRPRSTRSPNAGSSASSSGACRLPDSPPRPGGSAGSGRSHRCRRP